MTYTNGNKNYSNRLFDLPRRRCRSLVPPVRRTAAVEAVRPLSSPRRCGGPASPVRRAAAVEAVRPPSSTPPLRRLSGPGSPRRHRYPGPLPLVHCAAVTLPSAHSLHAGDMSETP